MDLSFFMEIVKEYGYVSMFIFNWLLLFGMPIPNEVAAAFSGVLTEVSYFKPVYAFISAYLGLITSNTFAYFIGRLFGHRLLDRLSRTKLKKPIENFSSFLQKHGEIAISFSFFLPGIRWSMPYVVGANKYPFIKYMLYAYTAGFVWMMVYFNLGRTFPYAYNTILNHLQGFLILLSVAVIVLLLGHYYYRERKLRK
ncbi:alkaline phosphatase [Planococcus salinarum]|uniref:Alkaline phosphatase n=1 Tax=Planococcus salinarum TaxID=622695 RepID=A0ABX3D1R8_9BACL|nr:DedA family protein [Planococcus salinarum]OHX51091.1 alkaline phosphatase [Planococcus salinarum]TAA72336.1 DedA family protein [Planococcus salinarum]